MRSTHVVIHKVTDYNPVTELLTTSERQVFEGTKDQCERFIEGYLDIPDEQRTFPDGLMRIVQWIDWQVVLQEADAEGDSVDF